MRVTIGYSEDKILFSDSYLADIEVTIYSTSNQFYIKIDNHTRLFKVIDRRYDIEEQELFICVV